MTPLPKSSKCCVIERYDRIADHGGARAVGEPADDPEGQQHDERRHAGRHLVLRRAREEQPDRDECGSLQNQSQVPGDQRPPFRLAVAEEQADVDERHGHERDVQADRADELAHDDLEVGERRRQEQLDRSGPLLFRVGPHRDHRQDEEHQHARVGEHAADQMLVDVEVRRRTAELRLHALRDERAEVGGEEHAEDEGEQAHHHPRDRRDEVAAKLLDRDGPDVPQRVSHAPPPPPAVSRPARLRLAALPPS